MLIRSLFIHILISTTLLWPVFCPPVNADTGPDKEDGTLRPPLAERVGLQTVNIDDVIAISLAHNPSLEVVRGKITQARGRLTQEKSGYLPSLSLSGRYYYSEQKDSANRQDDLSNLPGDDGGNTLETGDVLYAGGNLSQLLYDFGKTSNAVKSVGLDLQAVNEELRRKIQDIIFQASKAYYNVLEKRWLIAVAQESVKSIGNHADRARLYFDAGVRTRIDVINAEVELSNAERNLLRSEYDLDLARVELERIMGTSPHEGKYKLFMDEVQLDRIVELLPPVNKSITELTAYALRHRPDVIQQMKLVDSARTRLKSINGDYWPRITAEGSYADYQTDLSQFEDSWSVGVAASWDLFSGLKTKGEAVEAQGKVHEARSELEDLKLSVQQEVTESYLNADENRKSVEIALKTLEMAKTNMQLAEKRYETGAYDVLEYNDAQLRLTSARADLVVAYFTYLKALAAIDFSCGK